MERSSPDLTATFGPLVLVRAEIASLEFKLKGVLYPADKHWTLHQFRSYRHVSADVLAIKFSRGALKHTAVPGILTPHGMQHDR
jgi:hypothetical protein